MNDLNRLKQPLNRTPNPRRDGPLEGDTFEQSSRALVQLWRRRMNDRPGGAHSQPSAPHEAVVLS